jgi:hypothetical protein
VVAGFVVAIDLPVAQRSIDPASTQPGEAARPDSLDRYKVVWSRSLRDLSPAAPAARATTDAGELHLSLVGTVGHSLALLQTPEGGVEVRAVGETLGGAEVLSVEPLKVELRYNGRIVTLVKPPPSDDG